jgi:hypothetical protein
MNMKKCKICGSQIIGIECGGIYYCSWECMNQENEKVKNEN